MKPHIMLKSQVPVAKPRKTNFTAREVEVLLSSVRKHRDTVLFGVAGGQGWAQAWLDVAKIVSTVEGIMRTESDVRKKWTYLKWEAKNTSKPGRDPTSRAVLDILTSRGRETPEGRSLLEKLLGKYGNRADTDVYPSASGYAFYQTDTMEHPVSKEGIRALLLSGEAIVLTEVGPMTGQKRVSDVWAQFGKVRVLSDGSICNDAVACSRCFQVYVHRSKRQGTSSLRLHRCVDLLAVPQQVPPGTKQVVPPTPPMKKILPQTSQPMPKPTITKPAPARPVSPPQPPPPPPEVCLRWNSYHSNMQATFPSLLNNEQFVDVTLACEGRSIKCHKMMLSACSSYFEELLSQNPCQHPIVLMKDLKFWEVQALVDFMYRGEVNVGQDKLPSLLAAAEALQIKGLAGPASTSSSHDEDSLPPSLPLTTEDYLDESASSPSSARRARKRRTLASMPTPTPPPPQQNTITPPNRNPVGRPRLIRPAPQPSTSYMTSEPPLRRARRSEPTALPVGEIKIEPVDIDISNDSIGNDSMDHDDGFDMKKDFENNSGNDHGNASSRRADEPGDGGGGGGDHEMTGSICDDNSALLSGHDSEHMDYGNNNGMNSESADTGTATDRKSEIQGYSYTEGSSSDPGMSTSEINPSYPEVVLNPDNASSDSILGHM